MKSVKQYLEEASGYCKTQQFDLALPILKEAISRYPDNEIMLGLLASTYLELSMVEQAEKLYQDIIRLNPKNYLALHQLGFIFFKRQDWALALEQWQSVIQQPADFLTKYYAALAYGEMGEPSLSKEWATKALAAAPQNHPVYPEIEKFLSHF